MKFSGLGWRSLSDCQDWIQVNFPSHRYGLIMDPLLMLDRVFGSDDAEGDSQSKVLESRVKLKIATGAEAAVIKSLHFQRPRIFNTGQESMTTEQLKSKLNKLKTQKVWKSGREGHKAPLLDGEYHQWCVVFWRWFGVEEGMGEEELMCRSRVILIELGQLEYGSRLPLLTW